MTAAVEDDAERVALQLVTERQAREVLAALGDRMEQVGLQLHPAKTKIVYCKDSVRRASYEHTSFTFLGFTFRPRGMRRKDGHMYTRFLPAISKDALKRISGEVRGWRLHRKVNYTFAGLATMINPVVAGWVAYYRTVVSSGVFHALTDYLWKLTYKWARWSHQNKPKRWIAGQYFGKFNKFRNDRWVFGDRDTGAYLPKPAWTDIVRHTLVKGGASPDDPALAGYWAERRQKVKPPLDSCTVRLLSRQDGRCSLCGENLLTPDQPPQSPQGWERWFLQVTRKAIEADYLVCHDTPSAARSKRTHLVHATCQRSKQPRSAGITMVQQTT